MKSAKTIAGTVLIFILVLTACSSEEDKLTGVWKVEDVDMETDESKISKQQIDRIVEMQKSVHFQINKDHQMNIITAGDTFPASWSIQKESGEIYMKLEGSSLNDSTKIGKFEDGIIVSREKTPAGWVTIKYNKD